MFSDSVCAVMQTQKVYYSETANLNKHSFLNAVGDSRDL